MFTVMKNFSLRMSRVIGVVILSVLCGSALFARERPGVSKSTTTTTGGVGKAAGCAPSTAVAEFDFNNIRFLVETGGNMWQDRSGATSPGYEAPKQIDPFTGPCALYAGALWMGGLGPDNNLKLAAVRFRQVGNDFWPGPLDTTDASTDADVCSDYDQVWGAKRSDVELHRAYFDCLNSNDCSVEERFPDYVYKDYFDKWPAEGNVELGHTPYMAPFYDYDNSGSYNPDGGDYPNFDLRSEIDCRNRFRRDPVPLFGDSTMWWVFNDKGNTHGETGGLPIGMEIRAQAFAFSTNDEVNNMTFYNYVLINRGNQVLTETYFGQWVDADLGGSQDDYVGCDVQRGLGYCYNSDDLDEGNQGSVGYGVQPPAIGIDFFEGPYQDEDFVDNPLTTDCQAARDGGGIPYPGIGIGYGDGVVDNERFGMRKFLYHNNTGGPQATQDPSDATDYYNFMRGRWRDNSPMIYGGIAYSPTPGGTPTDYMFPRDSDPLGWGADCAPQALG
jgi:hypothetical protein